MADDQQQDSEPIKSIEMVEFHTGEEIALGISAQMKAGPGASDKGSPAGEGKAMSGQGQPLASAAPPPPPADASTSAKPANGGDS
jgi:hypothetical protein